MRKIIFAIWRMLFARKAFYKLNKALFNCAIRGMGIYNYENNGISGETFFLNQLKSCIGQRPVIFDVGANVGEYTAELRENFKDSEIYSFEPHPETFKKLDSLKLSNTFQMALGDENKEIDLYFSDQAASEHATLYNEVISELHKREVNSIKLDQKTLDSFVKEHNVSNIDFLKIDVEGHELAVMKGAKESLASNIIKVIQIEFNEMNIISKSSFKDFYDILKDNYSIYRLLPQGAIALNEYEPLVCEIYGFQNLVAVEKSHSLNKLM